jgi:hypothetical protein
MNRIGIGILFGMGGAFLQSVTEWVFRQTHIYLTFHVMLGTLAALCWCKRNSKRQTRELAMPPAQTENTFEYEPEPARA